MYSYIALCVVHADRSAFMMLMHTYRYTPEQLRRLPVNTVVETPASVREIWSNYTYQLTVKLCTWSLPCVYIRFGLWMRLCRVALSTTVADMPFVKCTSLPLSSRWTHTWMLTSTCQRIVMPACPRLVVYSAEIDDCRYSIAMESWLGMTLS